MAKLQPAVMQLNFQTTAQNNYISISQAASIVNRRFYREGLQWAVAGITATFSDLGADNSEFKVETLPTTWVCSNAWEKAFRFWLKQQNDTIAESGSESAVAKFRDFKVFMDTDHVGLYSDAGPSQGNMNLVNLRPLDGGGAAFAYGEWEPSQIVLPNQLTDAGGSDTLPAERLLHMVGTNNATFSKGIIDGYANSRAYPQSPDPVEPNIQDIDNWLNRMFDDGNANPEILQNATDTNDELPYDQVEYPGGEGNGANLHLVHKRYITGSQTAAVTNTLNLGGFMAPCGLIKIVNTTGNAADITVHLVPGKHRGYLASPMQDM